MIKLSTKGRYGARLMLYIAAHYGNGPVPLKDIARDEEISLDYLENLLPIFKGAGLLISSRGPHGGYELSKPPDQINMKQIVETMEGPITLVDCVSNPSTCKKYNSCVSREVWKIVAEQFSQTLASLSLADLVKMQHKKTLLSPEYTI